MNGMKEGAGADPFADDEQESTAASGSDEESPNEKPTDGEANDDESPDEADEMPYVLVRDRVKQERTNEHAYFLRDDYSEFEAEVRERVADRLEMRTKDVPLTDVREAIVATADPEAIAEELLEWGYEYK